MVNEALLNTKVQNFIRNFNNGITKLAFSGSPFKDVPLQDLLQQIESRNKIEKKLPTWFATPSILFPPKLNLEQTSSEITAAYKASLVSGESMADITGGFGIDSFFFSKKFSTVHHFEVDSALSGIAEHNFRIFDKENIHCFAADGLKHVLNHNYNLIYVDPSRRHERKGKVFFLNDCKPNIPEHIPVLLDHCKILMLKTSPMLDLAIGLKELSHVAEIHVVAIDNEVKELLWLLKKNNGKELKIRTVNFTKAGKEHFDFAWNESGEATYSLPLKYLYEPNAAVLKSGAFDLLSKRIKVDKLNKNTHLYTSENLIDFPGRQFIINKVVPYQKSEMRAALTFKKANITTRNFPESVATLRKKWKIKDGGDIYLFFTTNVEDKKQMLVCSKV